MRYMHDGIPLEIPKVAMRIFWFAGSYLSILYGLRALFLITEVAY